MRRYPESEILEYRVECISGSVFDRPGFQRLLSGVVSGKIRKIITFENSRLSREFLGTLNMFKLFQDRGVEVEVLGEGVVPFATTVEQFRVAAKSLAVACPCGR